MSMNQGFAAAAALTAATQGAVPVSDATAAIVLETRVPITSVQANEASAEVCMGIVYKSGLNNHALLIGAGSAATARIEYSENFVKILGPGFEAMIAADRFDFLPGEFVVVDRTQGTLIRSPKPETMEQYPKHLFAAGPSYEAPAPQTLLDAIKSPELD